jgi:hypothetical protein
MRYRHGLQAVEAFCWTGELPDEPAWAVWAFNARLLVVHSHDGLQMLSVGDLRALPGDWVVRNSSGEISTCTEDVFTNRCRASRSAPIPAIAKL